ncbi:unnamed protein product [Parnassius apollo]|uniref:RNA helicase n=1 Tax=Parnassius apollo TaxID=110799 RepID=A0A8S3Y9Q2_PARAO|nr:unnamed protein product [Parnassius apollo]
MDDEWDDSSDVVVPAPINNYHENNVDEGHSLSRGRGFPSFNDDDFGKDVGNGFGEKRGRGGRGGGRGRGGRGGRGGTREHRDFETNGDHYDDANNDDRGDRGDRGERGRGRGRGRGGGGGRGGRNNDGGESNEGGEEEAKKPPVTYVPPEPTENEQEIFSSTISSGINFDKFDCIAVKVSGENPPRPIESFESANLRKYVLNNILKSGYKKPTPIQKHAIPIIMSGRDLMGCAQTGSGKTAAFLLPIINVLLQDERELVVSPNAQPQVIIVSPTRELTLQIFNEARKFSHGSVLKVAVAYGGTAVRHQGDNISRGCHILVATPGRLHDFVDRKRVSFESVRFVVLDEADRMLDMGFMPTVEKMMEHPTMVPSGERQTLMFSATFPEDIQHLAGRFLNNYLFIAVGIVGGASTDVEQIFHQVTKYEKQNMLKKLIEDNDGKRVLVFVETKRNADFIAAMLSEQQMLTSSIHGDRMQKEREEALYNFKSGRHCILVATAVAARGLDIKNVDIVVNYDLPKSIDEYVHRIGRTGRVGNRGMAVSFFDADQDVALTADLAKILRQADQPVPDFLQGGGGTATYKGNKYGGSDVRNFSNTNSNVNQGQEPEEEW